MSSIKKTSSVIITVIIVVGISFGMIDTFDQDESIILEQITFDAIYFENEHTVQISFEDKSNNTKSAILEILGMDDTYHQEYRFDGESNFVEKLHFEKVPKYGWKTTPVTLEIQHSIFGKIGLKIEIHEPNQSIPKIIVEQK